MSDYLGHLVERSFAPIPALRPNTPSRFESSPAKSPMDHAAEVDFPIDPKTHVSAQRPTELTENNPSRIPTADHAANHNAHHQSSISAPAGAREKTFTEMSAPFSPSVALPPPSQNSSPTPRHADDFVRSVATKPRTVKPLAGDAPTKGILHVDSPRPVSSGARKENGKSPFHEISAPPSTIHVTIGRVEIKATPPPPAPSRATPKKNPGLSLETYLQRRSNGGRNE